MAKNLDRQTDVFSIHEAKTQLSRLIDMVLASGDAVMIGRRGKAEVMLAPLSLDKSARRVPGLYRSTIKLPIKLPTSYDTDRGPILLTAQSLLRWLAAPFELPGRVHKFISDPSIRVVISTDALRQILVWDARGDIDLGNLKGRLAAACTSQGIEVVPIQPAVAEKAAAYAGDVDQALAVLSNFNRA